MVRRPEKLAMLRGRHITVMGKQSEAWPHHAQAEAESKPCALPHDEQRMDLPRQSGHEQVKRLENEPRRCMLNISSLFTIVNMVRKVEILGC